MDGGDRLRRRKSLHQWLGLKSMVCCGSTWSFGTSVMNTQEENNVVETIHRQINSDQNDVVDSIHQQINSDQNDVVDSIRQQNNSDQNDVVESIHQQIDDENDVVESIHRQINSDDRECTFPSPRMNLAAALAAERHFRSAAMAGDDGEGTPLRVSLMRLLEETEREREREMEMDGEDEEKEGLGGDQVCCVCMGRKKGAALIPCGHTFCRVCCRELWLNRGSCPLCNRSILEILDIYLC